MNHLGARPGALLRYCRAPKLQSEVNTEGKPLPIWNTTARHRIGILYEYRAAEF